MQQIITFDPRHELKRIYTYLKLDGVSKKSKPCMAIIRPKILGRSYMLPLDEAWKFAEHKNDMKSFNLMLDSAHNCCKTLEVEVNSLTLRRVSDFIQDGLETLLKMPPDNPKHEKKKVAEATIKLNGETIEHEVKE